MKSKDKDVQMELQANKQAVVCRNCTHYCVHYIYDGDVGQFVEINYGHCIYPRNKVRMQSDTCIHFAARKE